MPAQIAFVLAWGALNFFWLAVQRRPDHVGGLVVALMAILIVLSQVQHDVL